MVIVLVNTCYFTNAFLIKSLDLQLEINLVCLPNMCKTLGLCPYSTSCTHTQPTNKRKKKILCLE